MFSCESWTVKSVLVHSITLPSMSCNPNFRDLGQKNADGDQFKAILAAEIIKSIDRERLTVRAAHKRTGIAAADFSRIRNADLGRFTVDRLMAIINRLGSRVEVKVRVRPLETVAP